MVHVVTPLRQWIKGESQRIFFGLQEESNPQDLKKLKDQSLLRRSTVAYGIVELIRHARAAFANCNQQLPTATSMSSRVCSTDNFLVQVSRSNYSDDVPSEYNEQDTWNNITGVVMISPSYHAHISEPSFLSNFLDENIQDRAGRFLEVDIIPPLPNNIVNLALGQSSESHYCHNLGTLLYELYSGTAPPPAETHQSQLNSTGVDNQSHEEPAPKKLSVRYDKKKGKSYSTIQNQSYIRLQELGYPSSICLLVQHLIDCHDLYPSLVAASKDIHLLLCDPDCYLSDLQYSMHLGGNAQLRIKQGKLYGREKEVSLITDAFCRVSSGKSEAFFIGGYSGSGKTMLVQSLTARVEIAGGYVLSQKVDQMSKERPLLEVLAAFNNLCILIKKKSSPTKLLSLANKLREEFEDDFALLARLLPKITLLCPRTDAFPLRIGNNDQIYLAHNLHFTLQRFMRIVSSRSNPVVLFLDDCQWASEPAFDLIHAIISDTRGSTCFFLVGTYRDNEVGEDHPIRELMANLDLCSVEATNVRLGGLSKDDLNVMIAESLCVFPRICKPLSDIIYKKTDGSPFFALEFLRSLVSSRLLKYSLRERRWIWDEEKIRCENITSNVLYLLSNKMASLPDNVQVALKILACFGIKTDESIITLLCSRPLYSGFRELLDQAITEGCIEKRGPEYKFVHHDQVREAAYGLVPDSEKGQFHYSLGMLLLSASKQVSNESSSRATFQIADQLNHDLSLVQPAQQLDVAELNFWAGHEALDMCDFLSAGSYLTNAALLLPENHWSSNYEFSMELFFLRAKASYSCGNADEAITYLKKILLAGRCIQDKLDAHHYYLTILMASNKRNEAFVSCKEVLSQLNEGIPESVDAMQMSRIVSETKSLLVQISDEDWLAMKNIDDSSYQTILKFYSMLIKISFWEKPELMTYLCCRMIHITLEHGVCSDSVAGLVQFAVVLCQESNIHIQMASKIGTVAMTLLLKRYEASNLIPTLYYGYYGFVAIHIEKIQTCIAQLRNGYKVGMSGGDTANTFYIATFVIRFEMLGGGYLPSLLEETDYYIENAQRFDHKLCKAFLAIYRDAISTLIDKGVSTAPKAGIEVPSEETIKSSEAYVRPYFLSRAIMSFWQNHYERCSHYIKKLLQMRLLGSHNTLVVMFYNSITSFCCVRTKSGNAQQLALVRKTYKNALKLLKSAAELSPSNHSNKVHLLQAESYSFEKKNDSAKEEYEAAISSACSNNFVHEQGLAAELAAHHFLRLRDTKAAKNYFNQAKDCYAEWGSQMKVNIIIGQLEKLRENDDGELKG